MQEQQKGPLTVRSQAQVKTGFSGPKLVSWRSVRRFPLASLVFGTLAVAACWVVGCHEAPGPVDLGGRYQRLELEAVGGALAAPRVEVLASIGELGGITSCADWGLKGAHFDFLAPEGGRVLRIGRAQAVEITIPMDLRFEGTCEVTLRLTARGQPVDVVGRLFSKGGVLARAEAFCSPGRNQQEVRLRLEFEEGVRRKMDRLVLGFSPGVQPVFLYAVEIADVMAGGRLPAAAFGGWELVELGTDARRATFLAPGRTLRSRVFVDQRGLSLCFAHGAPAEFREGGGGVRVRVSPEVGEGSLVLSELVEGAVSVWVDERIALDPWVGQEVALEFALEEGARGYRALSQPALTRSRELSDPRTVLLVTSDTHRADHLGFLFEDGGLRTDAIDGLAARGVVFRDAVASINNTTPSHVALMTGLSPRDTGAVANALPLSDVAPTLAETFRDLGYATLAAVSASPVSYRYSGLGQGFDRYTGPGERSARSARETLEELQGWLPEFEDAPLFLWVHVYDAHGPYDPPEEYRGLYYPVGRDPYAARSSEGAVRAPKWDRGLQDPEFAIALYRSEITAQDEVLGELLARPRFGEGAIIAFTADHGETLLRGMEEPFGHLSLTYNTLAVPLILVAPGLTPGEVRAAPVQQTDVARALLNLAGYAGVEFPGEDLLGSGASSERPRFGVQANGDGASVLHGRWLLVLNLTGRQRDWGSAEESLHAVRLFDIVADPYCEQDVSAGHMSAAGSLRGLLIAWLGEGAQNDWLSEPNGSRLKIQQQLEELGYTASSSAGSAGSWIDLECSCERCALFLGFR